MNLATDKNFGEKDIETHRSGNTDIKQGNSQLLHTDIIDLQSTDSHLVQSSLPADADLIPMVLKPTVLNPKINNYLNAVDVLITNNLTSKISSNTTYAVNTNNISFSSQILRKLERNRRVTARLQY